ncbi:MAG: hypothetical protein LBL72_10740 [Candidatus Accumulibacter sp.]|nr:hypothetical protein [Accumulibacter sp.]
MDVDSQKRSESKPRVKVDGDKDEKRSEETPPSRSQFQHALRSTFRRSGFMSITSQDRCWSVLPCHTFFGLSSQYESLGHASQTNPAVVQNKSISAISKKLICPMNRPRMTPAMADRLAPERTITQNARTMLRKNSTHNFMKRKKAIPRERRRETPGGKFQPCAALHEDIGRKNDVQNPEHQ